MSDTFLKDWEHTVAPELVPETFGIEPPPELAKRSAVINHNGIIAAPSHIQTVSLPPASFGNCSFVGYVSTISLVNPSLASIAINQRGSYQWRSLDDEELPPPPNLPSKPWWRPW